MVLVQGQLNENAIHTAVFVKKMDGLFDLLNSTVYGRPGRGPLLPCGLSIFLENMESFHKWISSWQFINIENNKLRQSMPFQKGWLITLANMRDVANVCFSSGIPRLCTRRFNQDFLEVRSFSDL